MALIKRCKFCGEEIRDAAPGEMYCSEECRQRQENVKKVLSGLGVTKPIKSGETRAKKEKKNKRCSTCRFSVRIGQQHYCDYMNITGYRRDCEPDEDCTKYEKKWRRKK